MSIGTDNTIATAGVLQGQHVTNRLIPPKRQLLGMVHLQEETQMVAQLVPAWIWMLHTELDVMPFTSVSICLQKN